MPTMPPAEQAPLMTNAAVPWLLLKDPVLMGMAVPAQSAAAITSPLTSLVTSLIARANFGGQRWGTSTTTVKEIRWAGTSLSRISTDATLVT